MNLQYEIEEIFQKTQFYIGQVIISLNDLIALTEDKYSYIYEKLPAIEEEIKIRMREINILLHYLVYSSDTGKYAENESVIVDALTNIQQEFEEVTESFLNQELIHTLSVTFLRGSGQEEQSFSKMDRLMKDVRESLSDLRDLALNSLIFSIRVGEDGAGFQILADHINKISSSLTEEFSQMGLAIEELDTWNQDFQKKLVSFVEYEESLRTNYKSRFRDEFEKIREALHVICSILTNHLDNAEVVVRRVPEAMVLIQNQDIIRQNIENLVKCLQVAVYKRDGLKEDSREEVLNNIVFIKKVLELAFPLLDNIENGLDESVVKLEQVLGEIYEQAEDLAIETNYLGAFLAGTYQNIDFDFNVIADLFNVVLDQVRELLSIKTHLDIKGSSLLEGRESFVRMMQDVQKDFDSINSQIRTLKKMRVLIKIELSRINQDESNSMQSIAGAVDQVVETVYYNQGIFNNLKNFFVTNLDELSKAVERTSEKLKYSTEALNLSEKKLLKAETLTGGAVGAMVEEMGEICNELKKPYDNIKVREQVKDAISDIRRLLGIISDFIIEKEKQLFNYLGITQWEEKEEDFKALLDQFTCYLERKSASSVFEEFDTVADDHSTDIVLF